MKPKRLNRLWLSFIILLVLTILFYSIPRSYQRMIAFFAICIIINVIWCCIETAVFQKDNLRYIANMDRDIQDTQRNCMEQLAESFIVLNENHKIVWHNASFLSLIQSQLSKEESAFGKEITHFFPVDIQGMQPGDHLELHYGDRVLSLGLVEIRHKPTVIKTFSISDKTETEMLKKKYENSRIVVLMISVDNYEAILRNVRDSAYSSFYASIENILEKFIEDTNGILKHISNNRYMILMDEEHFNINKERQFSILDLAHEIEVEGSKCVTLSIGVGMQGANLDETDQFAKKAWDFAQKRGGDQLAIYSTKGFECFGGKTIERENTSKTELSTNAKALLELVEQSDQVFVMGHRNSDLDAVGSCFGLTKAIRLLNKTAYTVVNEQNSVAKNLIDYVKELDSDLTLDIESVKSQFTEQTLLVISDTHSEGLLDYPELLSYAKHIAIIDHHRVVSDSIQNTDFSHIEVAASSASQIVGELIQFWNLPETLPKEYADALLSGMVLDTKCFVIKTGVRTFEMAGWLRELNADPILVKTMFRGSQELLKLKSLIISKTEIKNNIAFSVIEQYDDNLNLAAPQAADELLTIKDVEASFVIFPSKNGSCITARSFGNINVQVCMEKFGGGGHHSMAAAQKENVTPSELMDELLEILRKETI